MRCSSNKEHTPTTNVAKPKKKGRGLHRGQLGQMMALPVEVFLEILTRFHPLDLLTLTRVSKELRRNLLSSRLKWLWAASLRGLEPLLPQWPDDISEPALASLVFEAYCMV
ncbi:uncharacterized protein BXZ73DRAFT_47231 [Epithele typhae]|uniref:uncharacterized protein n=1 Tax=Epithele typhae TaxID=378194 RepID=UPI0020081662|nr:uncharacterized protein BXZ73DRAFT_47231 [Epithele typhae]KAH9931606.1 hypothetical protein BXZ73DRAFT_47231 [Epithele typhae]